MNTAAPSGGVRAIRLIGAVVLGSLLYLGGLALGPRVPEAHIEQDKLWLHNIYLSDHFGVSLNRDSYLYLIGAQEPRTLLLHGAAAQSRPLLSLIAHPLGRLLEMIPMPSLPGAPPLFNHLLPTYLGFLLLNLSILVWCYWLYARMVLPAQNESMVGANSISSAPAAFVVGTLLVANDVTKAFFFAAHTQMLNLVVPLLALFVLLSLRARHVSHRTYMLHALLIGVATLAYAGMLVAGAAILLARIDRFVRIRDTSFWEFSVDLLLLLAMLMLPYIGWWASVTLLTDQFYSHEIVRWRQVVWMLDVSDKGWSWLATSLASGFGFFLASALYHLTAALPLVLLLLLFSWPHRTALKLSLKADAPLIFGAAVIAAFFLMFYAMVGHRVDRLAMPTAVMGIVVLGVWTARVEAMLKGSQRQLFFLGTAVAMAIQAVRVVVKEGPFY